jgi:hypothetical protein
MLERATAPGGAGEAALRSLIDQYPETPEADSARRLLGQPPPERPADFYLPSPTLATLASALPEPDDPMLRITDQLDRYAAARAERGKADVRPTRRGREGERVRPPVEREPGRAGSPSAPATEEPPVDDKPGRLEPRTEP